MSAVEVWREAIALVEQRIGMELDAERAEAATGEPTAYHGGYPPFVLMELAIAMRARAAAAERGKP